MTIEMLSGFLFLFIIILCLILLPALGYRVEIGDIDAELQKINDDPKKFQIGIGFVLIIFRIGEGLILSYNDKNYGGLLNIARKYSSTSGAEKTSLSDLARTITKTKSSTFYFAMIFWSIGTLAFSIVLVSYEVAPLFIGWLGIIASITVGFADGIRFVKHKKFSLKLLVVWWLFYLKYFSECGYCFMYDRLLSRECFLPNNIKKNN